jgi:hypothetical protein
MSSSSRVNVELKKSFCCKISYNYINVLQWLEQSLRNITEESSNAKYAYIRQEDICEFFPEQALLAVKLSKDTNMEFPPGEKVKLMILQAFMRRIFSFVQ